MASINELKQQIDLHDLAERLGLERPGGTGNYRSPGGGDKNPSLSIFAGGKAFNLHEGQTATLPDGLGTVTFDKVIHWNKLQISQTPLKHVALGGVTLALLGLLGSLFIRPRRVWVRARETADGTLVEVAVLDRSGNDEVGAVVSGLVAQLQGRVEEEPS